jgi:3D (Asp-Asp-Asp) domain-containing protein
VQEVLDEEGIVLPQGAFVHPSSDTPISEDMQVRVVQLGSSADIEYESIPNNVVYRTDPTLSPGETYTVDGQDGLRTRRYSITYVDGQEVSRELIEEVVDPEPVDTVVYSPPRVTEPPAGSSEPAPEGVAGRTLRVYATAYNAASAGRSPDDPNYGITATGVRVTWGVIAVDPNVIPLGTRMYIPGYGYGVAADTGGAVKGYIIDLGYPDGVPIDWETRWIDIYILE